MPIPKNLSTRKKIVAWLTWATVEEACETTPLARHKMFFRWLLRVNLYVLAVLVLTGCGGFTGSRDIKFDLSLMGGNSLKWESMVDGRYKKPVEDEEPAAEETDDE